MHAHLWNSHLLATLYFGQFLQKMATVNLELSLSSPSVLDFRVGSASAPFLLWLNIVFTCELYLSFVQLILGRGHFALRMPLPPPVCRKYTHAGISHLRAMCFVNCSAEVRLQHLHTRVYSVFLFQSMEFCSDPSWADYVIAMKNTSRESISQVTFDRQKLFIACNEFGFCE